MKEKLAILMTVYNRKETTVECIERVYRQKDMEDFNLKIIMVDDGQDGTGNEVRKRFPNVKVIPGNGNLFWCGGMRLSFAESLKMNMDYHLWLNDDSMLYDHALRTMVNTSKFLEYSLGKPLVVVGSMQNPVDGKLSYGGSIMTVKRWRPISFVRVLPTDRPRQCDLINGNCVLIPSQVAEKVGNLRKDFIHAAADLDYGLRAKACGYSCWVAPGFIGECERSDSKDLKNASIKDDLFSKRKIWSDADEKRILDWIKFAKMYGGSWGYLYASWGRLRLKYPNIWYLKKVINMKIAKFYNAI